MDNFTCLHISIGMQHNFVKYNDSEVDTQNTTYDYNSVMHYDAYAFSANSLPTISPTQAGVTIGQRANMSTIDVQEARLLYNCTASGQTLPPITFTTTGN